MKSGQNFQMNKLCCMMYDWRDFFPLLLFEIFKHNTKVVFVVLYYCYSFFIFRFCGVFYFILFFFWQRENLELIYSYAISKIRFIIFWFFYRIDWHNKNKHRITIKAFFYQFMKIYFGRHLLKMCTFLVEGKILNIFQN